MAKEKYETGERLKEVGKKDGWCHELLFYRPGRPKVQSGIACCLGLCASNMDDACIYRVSISASMIGWVV